MYHDVWDLVSDVILEIIIYRRGTIYRTPTYCGTTKNIYVGKTFTGVEMTYRARCIVPPHTAGQRKIFMRVIPLQVSK
jgi:hypothetical protein